MRGVWIVENYVTLDKSMINEIDRSISYVQYMPAKLIKNFINLFAICCGISTILLGFKVYVGQEDDYDNTAMGVCDELVKESRITIAIERTLYTEN